MPPSDRDSDSGWNMELLAAVSKQGKTKTISEEDRIKQIQECLDEGADIDTVDENGNTALHWAVKRGYPMVTEFLRKNGAQTDIPNHNGQTVIILARDLGKQEIICILNKPSTLRNSDLSSHNPSLDPSVNSTIRNCTAAAQDSSFDGSLSKMRLIDTSQADPQRDAVSDEQRSNRERFADDELVEETEKLGKMALTAEKEPYNTSDGLKQSFHGYAYQLKQLITIMYRARELKYSFRLATEMREAGKFDDVVLRSEDSNGDVRYRFLQVKHIENEKQGKWIRWVDDERGQKVEQVTGITAEDLTQVKGRFSLRHYFMSWREIQGNPMFVPNKSKDFILCTNIDLEVNDLKESHITVTEVTDPDNILNLINVTNSEKQPRRYKLQIENPSAMWKTLKTKSGPNKATDSEILDFLDEFILAVNQPNEMELSEIIVRDIRAEFNLLEADIVSDSFQLEVFNWLKAKEGVWLTDVDANEFFKKMRGKLDAIKTGGVSMVHTKKLAELGIQFNGVNTKIQNFMDRSNNGSKQLLKIISEKQTLLTALQVFQTLAERRKLYKNEIVTFVPLEKLLGKEISPLVSGILEGSANRNLLIVDCESTNAKQQLQSLWNPIREIMANNVDSKMILITQADEDLGSECQLDCETCRPCNTEYSFENLTKESQKKLLRKRVTMFQGTKISTKFAKLLNIQDWDNLGEDDVKDLSNIMDTESLVRLISEDELQIGRELRGLEEDVEEYYVHRTIFRHVVIKKDILTDTKETDLIAISGLSGSIETCIQDELSRIGAPASRAQTPTNLIPLAKDREEEEFNDLCARNEHRNVHWLMKEQGRYIWKKSYGKITCLLQYRDDSESIDINGGTRVTRLDEDQHAAHDEPVIISDTAGMGKSTMLSSLASKIKKKKPDTLVLKINLNHHSPALAEVKEKRSSHHLGSIEGVIQFLVEKVLSRETGFDRKVFKRIMEKKIDKVALIFDSFDEISPTYEETVIAILQTLADYDIRKLLVATRPHTKRLLEAKLNAFSFEIRPFSTDDQVDFFTRFWKTKFKESQRYLNLTEEDRMGKYTSAMIKILADSIKDERKRFTGIPLQTKLVAEIFYDNEGAPKDSESCANFIASKADEPKFPKKIDLIYLYDNLVDKRFEIFFKKRGGNPYDVSVVKGKKLENESYIAKHETLALETLFNKDTIKQLLLSQQDPSYGSPNSTDREYSIPRDGIIIRFIADQPRFVHQTYAEYFAAKFFSKILKKREPDESFGKIFVAYILLEHEYETMRVFINGLLSDEYDDVLEGEVWTRFVKEYRSQKKETIFHLAAAEGNDHIIRIFLNHFGANKEDRKVIIHARDSDGRTAVHRAVESRHLDIIKLLVEDTDYEINCRDMMGQTPLYLAACMGLSDVVRYFIDKEADVNFQTKAGQTPLHTAAEYGRWEMVEYLLEKEADVNLPTNDGRTPAYTTALQGRSEMIKYLLEKGANINSRTKDGSTLLHAAARGGNLDIAEYLLKKGVDVNSRTNDGETPLYAATRHGQSKMVEHLLKKGANINSRTKDGSTLLHAAARGGNLDIAEYLLKKGVDVNSRTNDGRTPLHAAAYIGNSCIVDYLLEKGADLNSPMNHGETPLHDAAKWGQSEMFKYFLKKGADVNLPTDDGKTPLYTAVQQGRSEMVKYLLEKQANINSRTNDGETPLHAAAHKGNLEMANYLLKKGADVNLPTNDGKTPLYTAIQQGRLEMVKYLLEKQANINSQTNDGETPLHAAAHEGNLEMANYLLKKGADVNLPTSDGKTPLYIATQRGPSEMVSYFLEKGANIDSRTKDGETLLHAAAHRGNLEIANYLLKEGADVNLPTNDGKTPLYYATKEGRSAMFKYLLEKGAKIDSRTNDRETLLHAAAHRGNLEMANYLLKEGADVDLPTIDGKTPLYSATTSPFIDMYGRSKMVQYLLEKGADINARTNDGKMLLHTAAYGGRWDIADHLLEKGADVNLPTNDGKTPLYYAAEKGRSVMVKYLLEEGADINSQTNDGERLLHAAAYSGDLDLADYLLEKGADVNLTTNDGKTPLYIAVQRGRLEMVKYLLDEGADINSQTNDGERLLHAAAYSGDLDLADYLLEKGADVNSPTNDGETPVFTAARNGQWKTVKYLLEKGANVNSRTNSGLTPLHVAAPRGRSNIVVHLLEKGADVNSPTNDGETPLHTAAQNGRWKTVKNLLGKGAHINSRTKDGSTLLHAAARGGEPGIADYLLERGANVNSRTNYGETPLYAAAQYCRSRMVEYLLEKGADVNPRTNDGSTPLHVAGRGGELGIADYLLKKEANVDSRTDDGETPLSIAAEDYQLTIKCLLAKGANINSRTIDGLTPLHAAAREGELGIADYLLEKKANVNLPTKDGKTPLYTAAQNGRWGTVKYLLKKGANVNSRTNDGSTPLHVAAHRGKLDIVVDLLDKGADVNSPTIDGETPLFTAAQNGRLETVKCLLENRANINFRTYDGVTLLHAAAYSGDLDLADYLLNQGANVNLPTNDGRTPLYTAVQYGRSEMIKYLLEKEADFNSPTNYGETPLYTAAENGRCETVKYLLEKRAIVNSRTNSGFTPLHAAAHRGKSNIVDHLLEKGADVNSPTNDGETPVFTAARNGQWKTVKYLLEKGASVNSRTNSGLTLLHVAAPRGRSNIVVHLLEKGADVNSPTNDGETPLHHAAQYGHLEIVKYLVEKGANIDSQSNEGRTALDVATNMGHMNVVDYLRKRGATSGSAGHKIKTGLGFVLVPSRFSFE